MVNDTKIKARLLRALIITLLILPVIVPTRAQAWTQDVSAGRRTAIRGETQGEVSQIRQNSRRLAPFAGILPSGTPFLPSVLVNTIDTSTWSHPSSDPAGIIYQSSTGKLLISDIDVEETPRTYWDGFNVFQSTLTGSLSGNCTTFTSTPLNHNSYNNFSDEPAGITINNSNNRIYFSDDNASRIFEVAPGSDGIYCTSDDIVTFVALGASPFNLTDLEDLTYGQGKLYISSAGDGSASIYEYNLGANGVLGGGDDSSGPLTGFGTASLGFGDTEGIAYNSTAGTLYILSNIGSDAYIGETTTSGTLLRVYDMTYLGPASRSGLAIAPASGDPSTNNIYIVSRGADNDSTLEFNDGKIWEIDITNPVMPDEIFKDGFESGNFSAWTASVINGGNLSVNPSAALFGSYGMRAQISNSTGMEVTDDRPTLEKHYRARFYFDPNSISLGATDLHTIFQANTYDPYSSSAGSYNTTVLAVQFRFSTGTYQVRGRALLDSGSSQNTNWFNITDASHFIEVDWSAATAAGANNGYLTLWLDAVQAQSLTSLDNDTRVIDRARLGPSTGLISTTGTYYFDAFESRRQSYIGPAVSPTVLSVVRANSNPTSSATVNYTVTFSESVTGVDASDFQITPTGVTGATVSGASGSGAVYTVTVNTGIGTGSLRLDVIDDNSIKDGEGNFLEGGFSSGESYTIVEAAEIAVNIAQINVGNFEIPVQTGERHGFAVDNGPAQLVSMNTVNILPALRVIWREPGMRTSYSEMMGLPVEQLSTEYWFPWYNNLDVASMDQGFRIANLDTTAHTIQVFVGTTQVGTDLLLAGGGSVRVGYAANNGPARVVCTTCNPADSSDRILAALRVIWQEPGSRYSYSEMMGLPVEQLSTEYWFPWYNNLDTTSMDQGFRIAMVNASGDNTVEVHVGGVLQDTLTLAQGASVRVGYEVNNGPAQIVCTTCTLNETIITSLRVIWKEPGFRASYSEMMGLPLEQLSTEYWYPWYNNADVASMDQGFRIAMVNASGDNTVEVYVAGALQESLTLNAGESVRVGYQANNGPARVVCTTCTLDEQIVTSLRVIWKEPGFRTSYSEMMGLPNEALSDEYWFPWYNNLFPNSIMDQGFRISVP